MPSVGVRIKNGDFYPFKTDLLNEVKNRKKTFVYLGSPQEKIHTKFHCFGRFRNQSTILLKKNTKFFSTID
jgi:hypothetical protein